MGTGGWKTPFPIRFGGDAHAPVERAYDTIRANLGDALTDVEDSASDADSQAGARLIASADAALEAFIAQGDPRALSSMLPRWEAILGIRPSRSDSATLRRARVAARLLTSYEANTSGIDRLAREAFHPWTTRIRYVEPSEAVTYWPGNGYATQWSSTIAKIIVEYLMPAYASREAATKRSAACIKALDEFAPAWATFETSETQTTGINADLLGFFLDQPNLDVSVLDDAAQPFRSVYTTQFASTQYVLVGDHLNFERTDPFTFSCWAKKTTPLTYGALYSKRQAAGNLTGYHIGLTDTDRVFLTLKGTTQICSVQSTAINVGVWNHIVVTYNGTSTYTGINIWVNGVMLSHATETGTLTESIVTTTDAYIGRHASTYFTGFIDDVAFYDRVLSPTEIAMVYNSGVPSLQASGLAAFWYMGDGDFHPTILDHAGRDFHGTMTNMSQANIVLRG